MFKQLQDAYSLPTELMRNALARQGLNVDWRPKFGLKMKNVPSTLFSHHSWLLTYTHSLQHDLTAVSAETRADALSVFFSLISFRIHR